MSVLFFSMKTLTYVLLKIKSERRSLDPSLNLIKLQKANKIIVNRRWSAKLVLFWFSFAKILFRSFRDNAFFFLTLWAVTRFAASNMLVTKNDCKGRHLTMTYGKKALWKCVTCLHFWQQIKWHMHWLSGKETNLVCGAPLFPSFKILLLFFDRD